jgi:CRP/FNR family transcriptional regulator, dissimilatory nitrate respiration regulator
MDNVFLPELLQKLLPTTLQLLCETVAYEKGTPIFLQQQRPKTMFYVVSGEVVLQRMGAHGEYLVMQRVRQGIMSEASLFSTHYHCDGVVTESAVLVGIPITAIQETLLVDSGFAMRWIAMLNNEVKRLRTQCERLSMKTVKDRLFHLSDTQGKQGSLSIGIGLKSIAAELGVSHEALYRAVADLEKRKLLQRRDKVIQRIT